MKIIEHNKNTRWNISSKDFKPLFDLLLESDDSCKELHKDIKTQNPQHFVMSPEIAYQSQKLANEIVLNNELFVNLLPKIKTPYSCLTIEMPITKEINEICPPVKQGQMQLIRSGAFVKQNTDEGALLFIPFYEFTNGFVFSPPIALILQIVKDNIQKNEKESRVLYKSAFNKYLPKLLELQNVPLEKFVNSDRGKEYLNLFTEESAEEIFRLLFCWLILLNSKSGIDKTIVKEKTSAIKLGALKKRQYNRSGYTVISLSDMEKPQSDGIVVSRNDVSAHRVRGHFKVKKSGIFWWRPHVRGAGEIKERQGYQLSA
jgi:hypothetical protein